MNTDNPTSKATARIDSSRSLQALVEYVNENIDTIVQHEYEVAQWSGELISIPLVREHVRQSLVAQLVASIDEYIPTPIMPVTARVVIDDDTFVTMVDECADCAVDPFTGDPTEDCDTHSAYTFCDTHNGWTRVVSSSVSTGFAGGRIAHAELACGCVMHDESDDVAAAR